ncbi:hypothetical protein E2562_016186 [Oryza meyeriana var. granulata]|uniref:Uncharacterized protein n=1 Tax=Oryza meyeriana var. granulata TaxID=110450 RepID=A0A6G1CP07_9ORYZ|nr:hypothetical protein E2562_016186 [Oryza meyeriana var. granulata]
MDKVLAFSILSASPADLAAGSGGYWARLSWRRKPDELAEQQRGEGSLQSQSQSQQRGEQRRRPSGEAAAMPPRFAPEFDGIDCFETIVLH